MKLSIVTTMYQSSSFLIEFYNRIKSSVDEITNDYEIIFVNDGSPDNSLDLALELFEKDEKVELVDLSRNFGHHKAIITGLEHARGDYIFLIDCDLEEDPELVRQFFNEIEKSQDVDLVYGLQKERKGRWFERTSGRFFWTLFNKISELDNIVNPLTIRLMTRRYLDALLMHKEKELFLAGVFQNTGFNQITIYVDKKSRASSSYTFSTKLKLLSIGVASFSTVPLRLIFILGTLISILSLFFGLSLVIKRLVSPYEIQLGWTSIMVSIWLVSGALMMCVGIIGIYLGQIYREVKNRPRVIVKNHFNRRGCRVKIMNNLDNYVDTYDNDPFLHENEMMLEQYVSRCIQYRVSNENYLELGIGHGITLDKLSRHFSHITVLEGSPKMVAEYADKYTNVDIHEIFFEDYNTKKKYDNIGMGFVLEHVDDPVILLKRYRNFLTERGSIFIGVPSASSLHRILAVKAGMLDDIQKMSETDIRFGHKRFLTFNDWVAMLRSEGFAIVRAEGLFLKPFTTSQLNSLNLDQRIFDALAGMAREYPQISNTIFLEVKNE